MVDDQDEEPIVCLLCFMMGVGRCQCLGDDSSK